MTANVQLGDKAKDVDAPPLLVLYAWLRGSLRAAKGADAGASAAVGLLYLLYWSFLWLVSGGEWSVA